MGMLGGQLILFSESEGEHGCAGINELDMQLLGHEVFLK